MKLYHTPGACSTAFRIVAQEAGIPVELVEVDIRNKSLADGGSFLEVNSKGQVPTLILDNGDILTEGAIIMYGALPRAGMDELHRYGTAQDLFPAQLPQHA
ncbi:glutathione S-transferase N-terminal domain-containing protein [Breoghania sp. L-A4]|uniref:glutathione S-transferase N-terminal domain-containing protein n=1 Tax=Breoghania sp. L-A4 TaxID=2304600 RepID=UPI0020BDBC9A|nr:glutathione S-transferase N-terminal domain-containing protein [Breoghania sp. L-A4]